MPSLASFPFRFSLCHICKFVPHTALADNFHFNVDFGANATTDIAALAPHGTVAAYSSSSDRMPTLDYYAFARKSARLDFVQGALLSPEQLASASSNLQREMEELKLAWQEVRMAGAAPHGPSPSPPHPGTTKPEWVNNRMVVWLYSCMSSKLFFDVKSFF